ncbi:OmpH family outer membrane protein [Phaeocystidibacter luteus]|uniref:OmpH family outer membrane protein n=1 Tax=Phaeocystidibacter luteus TaxID=911197 RepID=A0A6N6RL50_9FLAO|nr:OmpH family outer membrane protein [Phaeocystidibacter luteus]KAB2813622.1 OmpH family outer membrane protein [Phaeocystidibacter luteus]
MRLKHWITFFAIFVTTATWAQRLGYVDTKYILEQIPEYSQAQREIDRLSQEWSGEIEALQSEADALQQAFDAEKILLTEEMQQERLDAIKVKREEARNLRIKYFGPEGELFKKRAELVKPIQDQVYNAIKAVARRKRLDFVFDKTGSVTMLYADPEMDVSDDVLDELGY